MATAKKTRRKPAAKKIKQSDNSLRNTLLVGLLMGGVIGFVVSNVRKPPAPPVAPVVKTEEKKPVKQNAVEPTYDFYTLLPEMEVEVAPKKPAKAPATPTKPVAEKTAAELLAEALEREAAELAAEQDPVEYMLQVGSFRQMADADRYRAKLGLLGFESKIQVVTIDNKSTWHRVLVGPIRGRMKADRMKSRLKEANIDALLVRVKKG